MQIGFAAVDTHDPRMYKCRMDHLSHTPSPPVPPQPDSWVNELAYDVALQYHNPEELQLKYSLSTDEYQTLSQSPMFKRAVSAYQKLVDEDAKQARLKVKRLASVLVEEVARMAMDRTQEPAIRLRAIENICRYAELEKPSTNPNEQNTSSPFTINIQINQ